MQRQAEQVADVVLFVIPTEMNPGPIFVARFERAMEGGVVERQADLFVQIVECLPEIEIGFLAVEFDVFQEQPREQRVGTGLQLSDARRVMFRGNSVAGRDQQAAVQVMHRTPCMTVASNARPLP